MPFLIKCITVLYFNGFHFLLDQFYSKQLESANLVLIEWNRIVEINLNME